MSGMDVAVCVRGVGQRTRTCRRGAPNETGERLGPYSSRGSLFCGLNGGTMKFGVEVEPLEDGDRYR